MFCVSCYDGKNLELDEVCNACGMVGKEEDKLNCDITNIEEETEE